MAIANTGLRNPSHTGSSMELILKTVDVSCSVCLEVCMRNFTVCQRGHSLCYDCATHVCCAMDDRCPSCRERTFPLEACTPDLTKNSICELVRSVEGGVELARQGRHSMLERERLRREHTARQRETLRGLVGNLRTLSESLNASAVFGCADPLPLHWKHSRKRPRAE